MGNKQLIKTIIVSMLLILLIIFPSISGVNTQVVWGYVYYSDGSSVPVGVVVTLTNLNNNNSMITLTIESLINQTGYYGVDIFAIPGTQDGDTIQANVSYGGCTGDNTVVIDINLTSQRVDITIYGNFPPAACSQPSGNTSEYHGTMYNYSTSTTDPDEDQVYYWFDWGDDTNSGWVGPYASGATGSASHAWTAPGTYQVKAKARDEHGAELGGGWSDALNVTMINQAPGGPSVPTGLSTGYTNVSYLYYTNTTDPNSDDVYYWFDWGDDTNSGWVGPYASGATGHGSHSWSTPGTYQVKAKVKDEHGVESEAGWSDPLNVTINQSLPYNLEPVADFTYTPTNPVINTLINFTDISVDYDGSIVNWSWSFGDGTNSTEQNPTHIYTQTGSYLVNLTVTDDDQAQNTTQKTIIASDVSEENITTIMLKYDTTNKAHKGRNLIAWRGDAISASMLAASTQLSYGDSISIFNTSTGQWKQYIVGVSNASDDFNISTWGVIDIRATAEKNIKVNISKTAETSQQITLQYIPYSTTTTPSNYGYNYFVWTSTTPIKASDLAEQIGLNSEPISKYDPQTNTWMGYITGLELEKFLVDFTISMYDIVCVKVNEEKSFTIT